MTWAEFLPQMERLRRQWTTFYSDERVKVIWGWVQSLEAQWWEKTVTYLLGHHADTYRGPLVEVEQAALREREKRWEEMKRREHREAVEFFQSAKMPPNVRERLAKLGLCKVQEGEG
jgi:hypothetical protein